MAALGRVEKGVVDCCGEWGSHWFWRWGRVVVMEMGGRVLVVA